MGSGGRREGAGRKAVSPEAKRPQIIITIAPETKKRLIGLSDKLGLPIGRIIDHMVTEMKEEPLP